MLTTFDLDEYVFEALRAGASGSCSRTPRPTTSSPRSAPSPRATRSSRRGHPSGDRRLRPSPRPRESARDLARLSEREREVLLLVARGRSNAEIAADLFLGEATVKTHLSSLFAKLGLRDRVEAVIYAYESGLIEPGVD